MSTSELLLMRFLERAIDQRWIDWAVSMLLQGHDTEHLRILAGEVCPVNQFVVRPIVDRALSELGLDWSGRSTVIDSYALELSSHVVNRNLEPETALQKLRDLCIDLDYDESLMGFYRLYFAKTDLEYNDHQWYWDGANRSNIDQVIIDYCSQWVKDHRH